MHLHNVCEKFVLEEIDLEKNEVGVKRAGLVDAHIQQSFGQQVCRMATAYPLRGLLVSYSQRN